MSKLFVLGRSRKEKSFSEYYIFAVGIICVLSLLFSIALELDVRSNIGKYGPTLVANTLVHSDFSQADQVVLSQLTSSRHSAALSIEIANKEFLAARKLCKSIVKGSTISQGRLVSIPSYNSLCVDIAKTQLEGNILLTHPKLSSLQVFNTSSYNKLSQKTFSNAILQTTSLANRIKKLRQVYALVLLVLPVALFVVLLTFMVLIWKYIRKTQQYYRNKVQLISAMEFSKDAIAVVDTRGKVLGWNSASEITYGIKSTQAIGRQIDQVISPVLSVWQQKKMMDSILKGERITNLEMFLSTPGEQEARQIAWNFIPIESNGKILGNMIITSDLESHCLLQQKLDFYTSHDSLTGLYNKDFFYTTLKDYVSANDSLVVIFIELPGMKTISTINSLRADEVRIEIATQLDFIVGSNGILARFANEGFVILLKDKIQKNKVMTLCSLLFEKLQSSFIVDSTAILLKPSMGIAFRDLDSCFEEEDPFLLIQRAKIASKVSQNKKVPFTIFEPGMDETIIYPYKLESEIRLALSKKEFVVFYQPIIGKKPNCFRMEALARWQHPTRGIVSPDEFIPIAESSGLIVELGKQVFEDVCLQLSLWEKSYPDIEINISINISAIQLLDPNFVKFISETLSRFGVSGSSITLELTENLLEETESFLYVLNGLRTLGLRFSVDDFGTGYSSLSRLCSFAFDELKIDKSFVDRINEGKEKNAFIIAIIAIANSISLDIVAEGVEYQYQKEFLISNGCHFLQGYLFGVPMPSYKIQEYFHKKIKSYKA